MQDERYPDWLMERFWAKVDKTDDCWLWTGATTGAGYGAFRDSVAAKRVDTHRFAYKACVGPIPDGLVIDHLCSRKLCVRPDHLEPVTQRVNIHRGLKGPANITHCPTGHPYEAENLYVRPNGNRVCRACHRERVRTAALERLTDRQHSALSFAVKNGRWWITGKGSNMVVAGLVQRGLVRKGWQLLNGRPRFYIEPTGDGRAWLLDGGEVRPLRAVKEESA